MVSGCYYPSSSNAFPIKLSFRETTPFKNSGDSSSTTTGTFLQSLPPTLFLHGLDSSSHTWRNILEHLDSKAVALDLRGCGHSFLGNPDSFSPQEIVHDIYEFLSRHAYFTTSQDKIDTVQGDTNIIPFVLVGHSMGGRIAMSFASCYPHLIKALVIEDMDTRSRPMTMNIFQSQNRESTLSFQRDTKINDIDDLITIFENEGYPASSIKKWLEEGRIIRSEDKGTFYSEVNPAFRLLCYEQFFLTNHGENVWKQIAHDTKHRFPIHVMVADKEKTVCDENSIWWMKQIMKEKGKFMVMHRYENATHSIHNSSSQKFLEDLRSIIRSASLG